MIEGQFKNNLEKEKKWNEALSRVEKITDARGMPIDPGIKETVVAFLVNGFDTEGSCEGHIDRARPYPWIDIAREPQSDKFKEDKKVLTNQIKDKKYETFFDIPETDKELYSKFIELRNNVISYNKEVENKMRSLLDDFYSFHKPISEDYILTLLESWRIEPVSGAGLGKDNWREFELKINSMTPEEKSNYLKNSQNEMKVFTEFLKGRFMKGKI
jgi:hypothetical protein